MTNLTRYLFACFCILQHNAASAQLRAPMVHSSTQPSIPGPGAYVIESIGASAGSFAGFGVVYLVRDTCENVDDLGCTLERVAVGLLTSSVGAVAGDLIAGNAANTEPSALGATLGAVAGVAVGLGTWHLFTEELDISNKPAIAILAYSVSQGLMTAAGSRLVRAFKR